MQHVFKDRSLVGAMSQRPWIVLVEGHGPPAGDFGDISFLPYSPDARGDGYLAFSTPTPGLWDFPGLRAWYWSEPITFDRLSVRRVVRYLRQRKHFAFLHHSESADVVMPVLTHYTLQPQFREPGARLNAAVAVVSNHGGVFWRFKRGERLRNRFVLCEEVELFGSELAWSAFRRWPWSSAGTPKNYRGAWTASYLEGEHIARLSKYQAAVCLENCVIPNYFSEKFVNAVRAGCVPIYAAHSSVRTTYLDGALFVDPANHNFDPVATVQAALALDREAVAKQNFRWLESPAVQSTGDQAIWRRIAEYFSAQFRSGTQQAQIKQVP